MPKISLAAARINSNLTQEAVAKLISSHFGTKYSRQKIANIEKDPGNATVDEAKFFSKLYKLPIDNIFFD